MRIKTLPILLIFLFALTPNSAGNSNENIKSAMNSVVVIDVKCNEFIQYVTPDLTLVQKLISESTGAGVILTSDGLIVTNYHVISNSTEITVTLFNGEKHKAKVLIEDPYADLALIKIDAINLAPIELGNYSDFSEGDDCWAIGNPENLGISITKGIITSKSQYIPHELLIERYFRFNAKVYPGNSGGALLDKNGNLIGIPNLKYHEDKSRQNSRLGGEAVANGPIWAWREHHHQIINRRPRSNLEKQN